ncbi:FUSC family protein [Leifsonia shinshuensis]|uniref:FUSC family protein n=1 Tax=Leifsonia shinshuensis TaxID=150026 RepID=UPI00285B6E9F|nr:FUSC family protein [Leifsonia shinshuensis]MDR6972363.1 putative membrane protein YccC [Leifsonia shinshuensis]
MRVWQWLARHDPGYSALRRAGRAAIVMPLLFAFASGVIRNPDVAIFSAFGSFAMLLFVDFGGPLRERAQALAALAVAGAVLVCLGTLTSQPAWLSALAMAVVALAVLFAGAVSSVTASASTALLLAFVLPVTLPGTVASLGPRLLGWGMAAVVCIVAVTVLWPAPSREPLRGPAVEALRALSARLRAESAYMLGMREALAGRDETEDGSLLAERDRAVVAADAAVGALHESFLATPYRPTSLSTPARTIVRLVDELNWLDTVMAQYDRYARPLAASDPTHDAARALKAAAADVLDEGAFALAQHGADPSDLEDALRRLSDARRAVEAAMLAQPAPAPTPGGAMDEVVTTLDPGFRAQELAYAVATVGGNIGLTARAERRTWWQRLLGRQPGDLSGPVAAAAERASGYIGWNSVWLRNSIRGAIALGLAVLLAKLTGVEHSFWVVLGTLSVLRSNALSTGQTVLRGVLGTVLGVVLGAAALFVIGGNPVALWIVLPLGILVAGVAPAAISFAAGQAAFTVVLVLLFNIIAPTGWTVGLIRIEDIALGCAVSLLVGVLFWPRGAAASLRRALSDAYSEGIGYLSAAVAAGAGPRGGATIPVDAHAQSLRAAAASRRLDDAFRTYLAERGTKRLPLAEVSASVTGVAGVRLASDAILELWRGQPPVDPHTAEAREALNDALDRLESWYRELAARLLARGPLPEPVPSDPTMVARLAGAVLESQAHSADMHDSATAVRLIWTADYLEVVSRLETVIVAPVQTLRDAVTP